MTVAEARWKAAQKEEGELWDAYASTFESSPALLQHLGKMARSLDFAEAWLESKRGREALEIGVGPLGLGALCVRLARDTFIVGVDPLARVSLRCDEPDFDLYVAALRSRVGYCQASGEQLPFADGRFDLACSHNVLDHCHAPRSVLHEIWRVLAPGGVLVLTLNTFSVVGRLKFELLRKLKPQEPNFVMHPWTFTHRQIRELAHRSGFHVERDHPGTRPLVGRSGLSKLLLIKPHGNGDETPAAATMP